MNSGRIMNLLVTIPAESRRMNVGKEFQNTLVRYSIRPEQSQRKRKFLKKNLALQ